MTCSTRWFFLSRSSHSSLQSLLNKMLRNSSLQPADLMGSLLVFPPIKFLQSRKRKNQKGVLQSNNSTSSQSWIKRSWKNYLSEHFQHAKLQIRLKLINKMIGIQNIWPSLNGEAKLIFVLHSFLKRHFIGMAFYRSLRMVQWLLGSRCGLKDTISLVAYTRTRSLVFSQPTWNFT